MLENSLILSSVQIAGGAAVLLLILLCVPRWRLWGWSMLAGVVVWALIEWSSLALQQWLGWAQWQSELASIAGLLVTLLIGVAIRDGWLVNREPAPESTHFMEHAEPSPSLGTDRISGALFRRSL